MFGSISIFESKCRPTMLTQFQNVAGQCNSLQAINIPDMVFICMMYKNKWCVIVNTCKEFHILPLSKGDPSVRDFRPFVRRIKP